MLVTFKEKAFKGQKVRDHVTFELISSGNSLVSIE